MRKIHSAVCVLLCTLSTGLLHVEGRPQTMVVSSTDLPDSTTTPLMDEAELDDENATQMEETKPIISEFYVTSKIQFRYAQSVVEAYIKNPSSKAQEIEFTMVIPDTAFISNFSMVLRDTELVASVEKKEKAKEIYDQAVSSGQGAGLVDQDTRNANKITVSANVEPNDKVRFRLTYEELLQRRIGKYEHTIHVNPGQIVQDFQILVQIKESLPVVNVKVPEVRTDPNAVQSSQINEDAQIEVDSEDLSKVNITYKPTTKLQKAFGEDGVSGEFTVQYDVDRKEGGNEVQVIDGYFVHFFAPDSLQTLPKHVVFVLDVSGSMYGKKLLQTKDAMVTVIDDLSSQDYFNILTFSDEVMHWVPENEKLKEGAHQMTYPGEDEIKTEALQYVLGLNTIGGTNINDAMVGAINLVEEVRKSEEIPANVQPMIIFLTDGEATSGVTSEKEIKKNVAQANQEIKVSIYGLAFGRGADFGLIKTLSTDNHGFARKIYEGSDAAIQLEEFYLEIASPLLNNLDITYVGEALKNESVTETKSNNFNQGGEVVLAGKIDESENEVEIIIQGQGKDGPFEKKIIICTRPGPTADGGPVAMAKDEDKMAVVPEELSVSPPILPPFPFPPHCFPMDPIPEEPKGEGQNFVERLWAFKTIKQLLSEKQSPLEERREELEESEETSEEEVVEGKPADDVAPPPKPKSKKDQAIDLALKYNFVTSVTSLVVVKQNQSDPNSKVRQPIEPVPVDLVKNVFSSPFSGGPNRRFGGVGLQNVQFSLANRGSGSGGGNFMKKHGGTTPLLAGPPGRPLASPTFYPRLSTTNRDYDESYDSSQATTSTTARTSCSGSISLHSVPVQRGLNVTLTEDEPDLGTQNFAGKLSSLEVRGDCCWIIYNQADFEGESINVGEGPMGSAEIMTVFRKALSVKKSLEC